MLVSTFCKGKSTAFPLNRNTVPHHTAHIFLLKAKQAEAESQLVPLQLQGVSD